jgi:diguanylate cyclase (GGDEF)-like protein
MIEQIYSDAFLLSGTPQQIVDQIVRWIADVIGVEYAILGQIEKESVKVVSGFFDGEIVHEGSFPVENAPCESILRNQQTLTFAKAHEQFPAYDFLVEKKIDFYAGTPIFDHNGLPIGLINAFSKDHKDVSSREIGLMELLGKRAGLELEHMRTGEKSQRLRRNLLDIGQEILQQIEVQQILADVAQGIRDHSPFNLVGITLYEKAIDLNKNENEKISKVVLAGLTEEDEAKLHGIADSGEFISANEIMKSGRPIGGGYYVRPDMIPELIPMGIRGSSEESGVDSWGPYDNFYFFLQHGDSVIGRISLGDPEQGRVPNSAELESLNLFANLASLALEKAQRLEEINEFQKRLQGIYLWSEQLADLEDFDELVKEVLDIMIGNFSYDHVSLFSNEGRDLVLVGFETRLPVDEYELENFTTLSHNEGVVGKAASSKKPVLIEDVASVAEYKLGHKEIRSEIAVPILEGQELLGVLNIENVKHNAFDEEDLELLQALSRQLVVTMKGLQRRQELQWINRFLQGLNQSSDLEEMLELIIRRGIEILGSKANAGNFLLWDEVNQVFEFRASVNRDLGSLQGLALSRDSIQETIFHADQPIIFTRGEQLQNVTLLGYFEKTDNPVPGSTISLPIKKDGELIAILNINNLDEEGVFNQQDARRLWNLVSEIELALARAQDHSRLREMATHDALTNTFNRHFFTEFIEKQTKNIEVGKAPISLVMVDIDDFYQVNDRFGHSEGDRVLQQVAELIRKETRKPDIVVRYGGDEFLIIMPETKELEAEKVMERLRQKFEDWQPELPELSLSISFGVASWDPAGSETLEQVLDKADQFMYHRRQDRRQERRTQKQAIIGTAKSDTE